MYIGIPILYVLYIIVIEPNNVYLKRFSYPVWLKSYSEGCFTKKKSSVLEVKRQILKEHNQF